MDHQQAREHASVVIRPYEHSDAAETLEVFISAVTETASADYTAEQVKAWAQPERRDEGTWYPAMLARNSIVATIGGELAGFSDVSPHGYVDMMFVSPRHQQHGVARQLLAHVQAHARSEGTPRSQPTRASQPGRSSSGMARPIELAIRLRVQPGTNIWPQNCGADASVSVP
jgi:GNAT superfamily N-acetyltransferase